MRHFLNYIDHKIYYIYTTFIFLGFSSSLFYLDFPKQINSFIILSLLLLSILVLLLLIPRYEWDYLTYLVLFISQLYIYSSTILTQLNLITFYIMLMSPMLMFIFLDKRLFNIAITMNLLFLLTVIIFLYSHSYYLNIEYLKGSIMKMVQVSIISQLSLFLLHYLMHNRLKKMQQFYEEIQYYDRLSTTSNITASVVHEIKNPLTIIKGYLQLFKEDPEIPSKKKETIDLLLREVEQIKGEINFLLNMSKPNNNLKAEVINVQKELGHVISIMQSFLLASNMTVTLVSKEEAFISISSIEFKQLFINLIKNAVEASKSNQTIELEVEVNEKWVTIKVIDGGCGMTKEQLNRIGTPYYTNKPLGNGLGMIVCTNIISKYNGEISIMSELNKGTIVTVQLNRIRNTP